VAIFPTIEHAREAFPLATASVDEQTE